MLSMNYSPLLPIQPPTLPGLGPLSEQFQDVVVHLLAELVYAGEGGHLLAVQDGLGPFVLTPTVERRHRGVLMFRLRLALGFGLGFGPVVAAESAMQGNLPVLLPAPLPGLGNHPIALGFHPLPPCHFPPDIGTTPRVRGALDFTLPPQPPPPVLVGVREPVAGDAQDDEVLRLVEQV